MPKPSKKSSGKRAPRDKERNGQAQGSSADAPAQPAFKMDKSLSGKDAKRKQPPTDAAGKQRPKRQRASDAEEPPKPRADEQAALLAEIKALGGDESDLELINAADSDDDVYAEEPARHVPVDKALKKELAALTKELGFAGMDHEPASDADEGADDDQDMDGDDDDDEEEEEEEEEEAKEQEKDTAKSRKPSGMSFEPLAEWHAAGLRSLPGPTTDKVSPFASSIEALKQHAKSLLEQDAARYRTSVFASSSHKFLSTIMSSGTLNDKVSALTLAVQESPVHNMRAFDALMTLASKKSRAQAIGAIGALVDLLGPGTLLPSNRRLRTFQTQPGLVGALERNGVKSWNPSQPLPGKVTEAHLIAWLYEDWLKETYFKIIQLLEVWCSDEIEYSRIKAVDFVYGLLKEKPEQESNLLTLLVNKLGDRDRKIASRASYLLLQLQVSHPGMKPIIIRSVEQDILLHPSQDTRSKYYAVTTLNQTILSSKEPAVAESLVRIYFDLFVTLLKTGSLGFGPHAETGDAKEDKGARGRPNGRFKGKPRAPKPAAPETDAADKLVSAVLTGVNRAAPFVGTNDAIMESHLDTLFTIAHSANLNTGIQAMLLIQHLSSARSLAIDRFYRTLYESLLDPRLVTSSKQALYLNLLLRALKSDVDVKRVKAFAKRMLQITGLHQPPFVCGLLYVISHLRETFPDLSTLVEEAETSVFDDEDIKNLPRYDGRKRNPEHSNAHRSCLWEVIPMQTHFHPAVGVFAAALLDKTQKMAKPDMESHSLIRFLDKFIYRNPKTTDSARGTSIMQPLRATKDAGDLWLGGRGAGASSAPVNSAAFWNKKAEDVAAEDVFFHQYFQQAAKEPKGLKTAKDKPAKSASDDDDEDKDDEDEIWKALVSSHPDGAADDGSDAGFDDLDELDMASDDDDSPALSLDSDMEEEDEATMDGSDDDEGSDGLVAAAGEESDAEDEGDEAKDEAKDKKKSRRKMLKSLPMFASVDDYAEMLAGEEEGM